MSGTVTAIVLLVAFGLASASGREVVSVSIHADWAPDAIVPWQEPVTEATVIMEGVPDGSAMDSRRFLVGRFSPEGIWSPLGVTSVTHTAAFGREIYELTFDSVVRETVLLVVVAGSTSGL